MALARGRTAEFGPGSNPGSPGARAWAFGGFARLEAAEIPDGRFHAIDKGLASHGQAFGPHRLAREGALGGGFFIGDLYSLNHPKNIDLTRMALR